MKLIINQNDSLQETDIIINCAVLDRRIRNLADFIGQYSTSLEGIVDGVSYYIPLDMILYIDYVDKRTFLYGPHKVYCNTSTLAELEEKLKNSSFVRIRKNCIVNLRYVRSSVICENHRLKLGMTNGEQLIVSRRYKDAFSEALRAFRADAFYEPMCEAINVFEHDTERCIYNGGSILSFPACPKRTVVLSYNYAELLADFDVTDLLVGIGPSECSAEYVLPQYRAVLENIPILR